MPTYQYRCTECGAELEAVQKFTDEALTECPECSGRLRKVFNAVGVVFKGSGFYATDSRAAKKGSSEKNAAKPSAGPSGSDAPSTTESKKDAPTTGSTPPGSSSSTGSTSAA